MLRAGGNLSRAADILETSRKVLRDNLRYTDLYPWPGACTHQPCSTTLARLPHPHGLGHAIDSTP